MTETLLSGFFGAIIGGACSLLATAMAWYLKNEDEKEKIKFILQAINVEINELFKLASETFFEHIEKEQGSYKWFLKSNQSYFSMFERNFWIPRTSRGTSLFELELYSL